MAVRYGSLPFNEAISFFRQKLSVTTEHWHEMWAASHNHAFTVAGAMKVDLLADLRQAVDDAIANGTSLNQFQKRFNHIVAKHGWQHTGDANWRSQLIYETNLRQSYNAGREQQIQQVKAQRPYGLYKHGNSETPRAEHLKWNNLVLPLDDPWWNAHSPSNGWGCKCKKFALSERDLKRLGLKVGVAPKAASYEWVNPGTGEVHDIPKGIDPGFDYRPLAPKQRAARAAKQAAAKPPLAERLRPRMVPSALSTAKGVSAKGLDDLLKQLPEQAQHQLQDFLQAHPVKTLFIKQGEMSRGKASLAISQQVAEYLDVSPAMARAYYTIKGANRTGGFTSVSFNHVVVKVKASHRFSKVDVTATLNSAQQVIEDAKHNQGPLSYRLASHPENLKRHHAFTTLIEQQHSGDAGLLSTWLHELGHQVHYYAGAPDIPVKAEQMLTAYGSTSKHEFFAEGFAAMMLNRATLEQWQPDLVSWFDKQINAAVRSSNKRR
ncbi:phage minor head protein [Agarivorans gilvus]|uniref:Phage head morphogenesis domain-containing protein n=1 Tax=Agarivorans gilvus TaxID=680279 RepID=A0ABQ1HX56_9ALTE|nr:phage minor head protein [Agarivorans gilvus]GGA95836.1 hypothetical protein GCM10007414_05840 [Agarivorans gilvus]